MFDARGAMRHFINAFAVCPVGVDEPVMFLFHYMKDDAYAFFLITQHTPNIT
jgi:hypothetical protein